MDKTILQKFIENFGQLYVEATTSERAPLTIDYLDKLQTIKERVDHLDLNNGEQKQWYENILLGVLSCSSFYRAHYPENTYGYATFDSFFDLAVETLHEFRNAL